MSEMFDDNFNPLEDLHTCMLTLQKQTEAITNIVGVINKLTVENRQHQALNRSLKNHIAALESRISAIEQASTNRSH
jgi:allophanate hydrolase subunit 1